VFISANAAQEKEKKEKKVLLPAGISKSAAHTVHLCKKKPRLMQYMQDYIVKRVNGNYP
jgi:hypothetical protein